MGVSSQFRSREQVSWRLGSLNDAPSYESTLNQKAPQNVGC